MTPSVTWYTCACDRLSRVVGGSAVHLISFINGKKSQNPHSSSSISALEAHSCKYNYLRLIFLSSVLIKILLLKATFAGDTVCTVRSWMTCTVMFEVCQQRRWTDKGSFAKVEQQRTRALFNALLMHTRQGWNVLKRACGRFTSQSTCLGWTLVNQSQKSAEVTL